MIAENTAPLKRPVEWLFNSKLRWWFHVLFWMFIYSDELLSLIGITEELEEIWYIPFTLLVDMIVVYAVIYIMLPLFLFVGKIKGFIFFSLLLITLNACILFLLWNPLETIQEEPWSFLITMFLSVFVNTGLMVGFASGIKIFKHYIINESRLKKLETDNLKTELVYLKNQINPHFLFNSLNNIYVLNRKDPNQASESILTLSDLLRYQLYECNQERVGLQNEINNLKNFIELEQLRKDNSELEFNINGEVLGKKIAPYIFIPFVENAIKHSSSSNNELSFLKIKFDITDRHLKFIVENSKPELPLITETGGIGLINVKRRLELVYPDNHNLEIIDEKKSYKVILSIELNNANI